MSLNWSATQVTNKEEILDGREWAITECLIFATMVVNLPGITAKNLDEFERRLNLFQFNVEHLIRGHDGKPAYFTRADLERRIGLHTNVTALTPAKWEKRFMGMLMDNAVRRARLLKPE